MAEFIARVELHDSKEEKDYLNLHEYMEANGFTRTIAVTLFFTLLSFAIQAQLTSPLNLKFKEKVHELGIADATKGPGFSWFPAKNANEAAKIWNNGDADRWTFLNMASISGTNDGGSATVDILSDFAGPMRVTLLGNVSSSKSDSTNKQQVERFLSSGGGAVIAGNLLLPSLTWGESSYIITAFVPKLGFDFPAMGSTSSVSTANLDLGIELKINLPFNQGNLGLFGYIRGSYTSGGTDFYTEIQATGSKPFTYAIMNGGFTFPKLKIAVLYTHVAGPSFLDTYNGNGRLSLVVSPKK